MIDTRIQTFCFVGAGIQDEPTAPGAGICSSGRDFRWLHGPWAISRPVYHALRGSWSIKDVVGTAAEDLGG